MEVSGKQGLMSFMLLTPEWNSASVNSKIKFGHKLSDLGTKGTLDISPRTSLRHNKLSPKSSSWWFPASVLVLNHESRTLWSVQSPIQTSENSLNSFLSLTARLLRQKQPLSLPSWLTDVSGTVFSGSSSH